MPTRDPANGPRPIGVTLVVTPRFPLHGLALAVDALRVANRESLESLFAWQVASTDGAPTASSAGIELPVDIAVTAIAFAPVVVLLTAYEPDAAASPRLLAWLKQQHRRGAAMGCVDTGALVLAQAGLSAGHSLCVHPLARNGAREDYPSVHFAEQRFSFHPHRFSATGGLATFDMMLALIEHCSDAVLARRVASMFDHRRENASESSASASSARVSHPVLAQCAELIEAHIEDPLSVEQLARAVAVPVWTLRRLFKRHLGLTPAAYMQQARCVRARQLLAYSHLSVAEIAAACGFAEVASFSRAFSRRYGVAPSRARHDAAGIP